MPTHKAPTHNAPAHVGANDRGETDMVQASVQTASSFVMGCSLSGWMRCVRDFAGPRCIHRGLIGERFMPPVGARMFDLD
jgi:hypothetical protein